VFQDRPREPRLSPDEDDPDHEMSYKEAEQEWEEIHPRLVTNEAHAVYLGIPREDVQAVEGVSFRTWGDGPGRPPGFSSGTSNMQRKGDARAPSVPDPTGVSSSSSPGPTSADSLVTHFVVRVILVW
jgi:hypothetical protein